MAKLAHTAAQKSAHEALKRRARNLRVVAQITQVVQDLPERRLPAPKPLTPTAERLAKMANGTTIDSATKAYQQVETIDGYRDYLPGHLANAWVWYLEKKATVLQAEAVRIGRYSGMRGDAFGPRDGQLTEKAREAAAIVRKIEAMMAPEFREVTAYIADILIDHSTGKLITCQEFASSRLQASLGRVVKDKTSLIWWTRANVYLTGARLWEFQVQDRAMTRSTQPLLPTVRRVGRRDFT